MSSISRISIEEPGLSFDENVATVVRILMASRGMEANQLAPHVGMTKSTMYLRLKGGSWRASELARIGDYFEVSPRVFYEPVEAISQNWKEMNKPDLRVLSGESDGVSAPRGALRLVPRG